MIVKSAKLFFYLVFTLLIASSCNKVSSITENPPIYDVIKTDPTIVVEPYANNGIVGQTLKDCALTGRFSVNGQLKFQQDDSIVLTKGVFDFKWEFVPEEPLRYNSLSGVIQIFVFEHVIKFETQGGSEVNDIYFNGWYSLSKLYLTAKNNYRFNGWTITENDTSLIEYPQLFSNSATLYANYSFSNVDGLRFYTSADNLSFYVYPTEFNKSSENIVIPDMYENLPVETMGGFADSEMTSVVIGRNIKRIDEDCFRDCFSLSYIYIPKNVIEIGSFAFFMCISLQSVVIEESSEELVLKDGVFPYCTKLSTINLDRFRRISDWTFYSCSRLKQIEIPEQILEIGSFAFYLCQELESVEILGNNLQSIGARVFTLCQKLKYLELPNITEINPIAFFGSFFDEIKIVDSQIRQIVKDVHKALIGMDDNLEINIIRHDSENGLDGLGYRGRYYSKSEKIDLEFNTLSIYVFNLLFKLIFNHYQEVLTVRIGNENYDSVPTIVGTYAYYGNGVVISTPVIVIKKEGWESEILLYHSYDQSAFSYITEDVLTLWREPYFSLLSDNSNYQEFKEQSFEVDGFAFAYLMSGKTTDYYYESVIFSPN